MEEYIGQRETDFLSSLSTTQVKEKWPALQATSIKHGDIYINSHTPTLKMYDQLKSVYPYALELQETNQVKMFVSCLLEYNGISTSVPLFLEMSKHHHDLILRNGKCQGFEEISHYSTSDFQNEHNLYVSTSIFYIIVQQLFSIPKQLQRLTMNGKELARHLVIPVSWLYQGVYVSDGSRRQFKNINKNQDVTHLGFNMMIIIRVSFRLLGGKGGFGAMLRGQKGKKKKTTNFDSCRDISGRRIRNAKAMARLKDWNEKKKRENELLEAIQGSATESITDIKVPIYTNECNNESQILEKIYSSTYRLKDSLQSALQSAIVKEIEFERTIKQREDNRKELLDSTSSGEDNN